MCTNRTHNQQTAIGEGEVENIIKKNGGNHITYNTKHPLLPKFHNHRDTYVYTGSDKGCPVYIV